MNPILLKELRQTVRSKSVIIIILIYMLLLSGFPLYFLIMLGTEDHIMASESIFIAYMYIAGLFSFIVAPLIIFIRNWKERNDYSMDLYYVSNLSAWKITCGKVIAYFALLFLLFTIMLAYTSVMYILPGFDSELAYEVLLFIFLYAALCNACTLFIVFAFKNIFLRIISLILMYILLAVMPMITTFAIVAQRPTYSATPITTGMLLFAAFLTAIIVLLTIFTAVKIMPETANRAMPVRLAITITFILVVCTAFIIYSTEEIYLSTAMSLTVVAFFTFVLAPLEPHTLSMRVRRTIPSFKLFRIIAVLYPGCSFAIIWGSMLLMGEIVFALLIERFTHIYFSHILPVTHYSFITSFYILAYSLTALWLYNIFLHRYMKQNKIAFITLTLILLGIFIPIICAMFNAILFHSTMGRTGSLWHIASLYGTFHDIGRDKYAPHYVCIIPWLALMFVLNGKYLLEEIRQFKPLPQPDTNTSMA